MSNTSDFRKKYVNEYLTSSHWQNLREQLIYSNPKAKCWICEKRYTLLPHHVDYKNKGHEKLVFTLLFLLFFDIAIVCFDCHDNIHFVKVFFLFTWRIPRKRVYLVKRMKYLRLRFLLKERRFIRAFWAFLSCLL